MRRMLKKFKQWFEHEPPEGLLFSPMATSINGQAYQVRKMENEDIDAALEIERRIYADTPWDRLAFISELRKVSHSLYLVLTLADGAVVAFVGANFTKDEAHVTNIAVDEAYQHQGLGRYLMNLMIARAVKLGIGTMTLEVRTNNLVAQHLYHQLGFKDGQIKKGYYVANHDDAMDMLLALDNRKDELN